MANNLREIQSGSSIEFLLEQMIDQKVEERVTAELQKRAETKISPWLDVQDVQMILGVGFKDRKTVIKRFCWDWEKQIVPEANVMGLTKKINGFWKFKNPEFKIYLHDVYWKGTKD